MCTFGWHFIEVDIKPIINIINISFVCEKKEKQQLKQKKRFSQFCPSVSAVLRKRIEKIFLWYYFSTKSLLGVFGV